MKYVLALTPYLVLAVILAWHNYRHGGKTVDDLNNWDETRR